MKRVTKYSALVCLIIAFGCSSNKEGETDAATTAPEVVEETVQTMPAVCVWDKLSVRETPGEKGKWLTSLSVGESLTHLGADSVIGNKNYSKIALNDGKEGWTRTDLIVIDAKPAVLVNDTDIYSRPDLLTKSDKKFAMMNIVASMNTQDSWHEVKGKRTGGTWVDQGWVKGTNLSFEAVDIATAKFALKALEIEGDNEKLEALNEILDNVDLSNSNFIPHIQIMVDDLTSGVEEVEEEFAEDVVENETDSIE